MKKENDQITNLFASRLERSEMLLKRDLWAEIEKDLPHQKSDRLLSYRWIGVAAVAVLVMVSAATVWVMRPIDNKPLAKLSSNAVLSSAVKPSRLTAKILDKQTTLPSTSVQVAVSGKKSLVYHPKVVATPQQDEDDSMVHVRVTIRQVEYGSSSRSETAGQTYNASYGNTSSASISKKTDDLLASDNISVDHDGWAAATYVSFKLHQKNLYGLEVEKDLSDKLSLVSGITLSQTDLTGQHKTQTLVGIPLKVKYNLIKNNHFSLYSAVGGAIEQCVKNGSNTDVSLLASIGTQYSLNKSLSLYAEPQMTYYINNQSSATTERQSHAFTPGIACGLRMSY